MFVEMSRFAPRLHERLQLGFDFGEPLPTSNQSQLQLVISFVRLAEQEGLGG